MSGRGQHLSLRLETGSYRGGREAVCSALTDWPQILHPVAAASPPSPRSPPRNCMGAASWDRLRQVLARTWDTVTTGCGGGFMLFSPLSSHTTAVHKLNHFYNLSLSLSLNRKYFCDSPHLSVFLHHIFASNVCYER